MSDIIRLLTRLYCRAELAVKKFVRRQPPIRFQSVLFIGFGLFVFGLICGLRIGDDDTLDQSDRSRTSNSAYSSSSPPQGNSAPIRTYDDLERASDLERQIHYEGVAERANRSGFKHKVTADDIREGVDAFYND